MLLVVVIAGLVLGGVGVLGGIVTEEEILKLLLLLLVLLLLLALLVLVLLVEKLLLLLLLLEVLLNLAGLRGVEGKVAERQFKAGLVQIKCSVVEIVGHDGRLGIYVRVRMGGENGREEGSMDSVTDRRGEVKKTSKEENRDELTEPDSSVRVEKWRRMKLERTEGREEGREEGRGVIVEDTL